MQTYDSPGAASRVAAYVVPGLINSKMKAKKSVKRKPKKRK